jgi:hypothetical protein
MDALTKQAISATLHCLTGCAIGEVLGMAIATALGWGDISSILLAIALAFFFGYLLSIAGLLRAKLTVGRAIKAALVADTISITSMEVIDNLIVWIWPGALEAKLDNYIFWVSLVIALLAAFLLTVPLNRWLIKRGKGHATVHQYHHH